MTQTEHWRRPVNKRQKQKDETACSMCGGQRKKNAYVKL